VDVISVANIANICFFAYSETVTKVLYRRETIGVTMLYNMKLFLECDRQLEKNCASCTTTHPWLLRIGANVNSIYYLEILASHTAPIEGHDESRPLLTVPE
jgi:hypothetical protein